MKKVTKKVCLFFVSFVFYQILSITSVSAEEGVVSQKIDDSSSKYVTASVSKTSNIRENIEVNKVWNVKFSEEMDENCLQDNIKILNKLTGQPIEAKVSLGKSNQSVTVTSNYELSSTYSLIVDKNIKSKNGKHLKNSVSVDFKTVVKKENEKEEENKKEEENENLEVSSIENIDVAINQNDEYNLPTTLNAAMYDGTNKQVKVCWDREFEGSKVPGKHVYYGTVNKYSKKVILNITVDVKGESHSSLHKKLCEYLSEDEHRKSVMNRAIELHDGDASNTCVYFTSEALRRAGLSDLPEEVCNTVGLTKQLEARGWSKSTDLSKLRPGDICFTISYGYGPTHAYTFMKWVDPKSYEYAYICDNQGYEYGNSYHKRNINFATSTKDPISYFMYMP